MNPISDSFFSSLPLSRSNSNFISWCRERGKEKKRISFSLSLDWTAITFLFFLIFILCGPSKRKMKRKSWPIHWLTPHPALSSFTIKNIYDVRDGRSLMVTGPLTATYLSSFLFVSPTTMNVQGIGMVGDDQKEGRDCGGRCNHFPLTGTCCPRLVKTY